MNRRYRISPEGRPPEPTDAEIARYRDPKRLVYNYHKATRALHRKPLYKDPKAFIGGMDGTPPALKLLREGGTIYRASMAVPLKEVGNAIAETADRLVKGEETGDKIVPLALVTEKSPDAQKFLTEQGVTD